MAMYIFADRIAKGKPISLFNNGNMLRDFTYIDDIVSGIISSIQKNINYEVLNLGNSKTETLTDVVSIIEERIGKKAIINYESMQLGDVKKTYADIEKTKQKLGYSPTTNIQEGINNFLDWYIDYAKK